MNPQVIRVAGNEVLLELRAVLVPDDGNEEREATLYFSENGTKRLRPEYAQLVRAEARPQIHVDYSDSQRNGHVPKL